MPLIAAAMALAIGIVLGLLGGGGSILSVPVFVYALGYEPKVAIAMGLLVVGGVAAIGAARHIAAGRVDIGVAVPFGLAAVAGAYSGAILARGIHGVAQLALLSVVMLGAAISMFRNPPVRNVSKNRSRTSRMVFLGLVGFGVGILTGLVGVGGGFLAVPALALIGGLDIREAIGTSMVVITMNAVSGYIGYHGQVDVPWGMVIRFGALATVGMIIGMAGASRLPQRALRRSFAVLLTGVAAYVIWNIIP